MRLYQLLERFISPTGKLLLAALRDKDGEATTWQFDTDYSSWRHNYAAPVERYVLRRAWEDHEDRLKVRRERNAFLEKQQEIMENLTSGKYGEEGTASLRFKGHELPVAVQIDPNLLRGVAGAYDEKYGMFSKHMRGKW